MTIFFNTGNNKEIITKEMLTYVKDKSADQKCSVNNPLVEARRIELLSESPFMQLSTSVFYLL